MKTEKLYILKEEAKKYFREVLHDVQNNLAYWQGQSATLEALEEVEQKIEIVYHPNLNQITFTKGTNPFTPNKIEREDIERLLNLGGMSGIDELVERYEMETSPTNTFLEFLTYIGK